MEVTMYQDPPQYIDVQLRVSRLLSALRSAVALQTANNSQQCNNLTEQSIPKIFFEDASLSEFVQGYFSHFTLDSINVGFLNGSYSETINLPKFSGLNSFGTNTRTLNRTGNIRIGIEATFYYVRSQDLSNPTMSYRPIYQPVMFQLAAVITTANTETNVGIALNAYDIQMWLYRNGERFRRVQLFRQSPTAPPTTPSGPLGSIIQQQLQQIQNFFPNIPISSFSSFLPSAVSFWNSGIQLSRDGTTITLRLQFGRAALSRVPRVPRGRVGGDARIEYANWVQQFRTDTIQDWTTFFNQDILNQLLEGQDWKFSFDPNLFKSSLKERIQSQVPYIESEIRRSQETRDAIVTLEQPYVEYSLDGVLPSFQVNAHGRIRVTYGLQQFSIGFFIKSWIKLIYNQTTQTLRAWLVFEAGAEPGAIIDYILSIVFGAIIALVLITSGVLAALAVVLVLATLAIIGSVIGGFIAIGVINRRIPSSLPSPIQVDPATGLYYLDFNLTSLLNLGGIALNVSEFLGTPDQIMLKGSIPVLPLPTETIISQPRPFEWRIWDGCADPTTVAYAKLAVTTPTNFPQSACVQLLEPLDLTGITIVLTQNATAYNQTSAIVDLRTPSTILTTQTGFLVEIAIMPEQINRVQNVRLLISTWSGLFVVTIPGLHSLNLVTAEQIQAGQIQFCELRPIQLVHTRPELRRNLPENFIEQYLHGKLQLATLTLPSASSLQFETSKLLTQQAKPAINLNSSSSKEIGKQHTFEIDLLQNSEVVESVTVEISTPR